MKNLTIALGLIVLAAFSVNAHKTTNNPTTTMTKVSVGSPLKIKIKNDTDNTFTVYNAGSGGSYGLTKNAITTISMDPGDELYAYEGNRKGKLLLTASADLEGKVHMLSKL
jgi:hypothetical protein